MTHTYVNSQYIRTTESERDKFHTAARDAILLHRNRIGSPKEIFDFRTGNMVEWKPDMRNGGSLCTPTGIARACMTAAGFRPEEVYRLGNLEISQLVMGHSPAGFSADAAFNVSGMFQNILLDAANVSLRQSFDDARTTYQIWARRGEDIRDFKPVHRVIAGDFTDPKVIPEDGEFDEVTLTDGKESYKLAVWGQRFSISWQAVVNDQLSAFMEAPEKMGRAMRRKMNRLIYQVLKDNQALADGVALFDDATHDNLTTGALSALQDYVTAWNTMHKKMAQQRGLGPDSAVLNLQSKYVLHPPAIGHTVREVLNSTSVTVNTTGNSGTTNIWHNGLIPVEEGELAEVTEDGSDTAFYLAADSGEIDTIEYAHLADMPAPRIEQQQSFDRLGISRRIYFAFGQKALDYRGLQKHTGAA